MANKLKLVDRIKAAAGLSEDTPRPGHWLESVRGPQLPAAPEATANEDVINRMLNTPVTRRTVLEQGKNAATVASMGNKLGALADLVPTPSVPALSGFQPDFLKKLPDSVFKALKTMEDEGAESPGAILKEYLNKSVNRPLTKEEAGIVDKLSGEYADTLANLADIGTVVGDDSPAYFLDLHRNADIARYRPSSEDLHLELTHGLSNLKFGDKNEETLNRLLDSATSAWTGRNKPKLGAYEGLYDTLQDEVFELYDAPSKDDTKAIIEELKSIYGPKLNTYIKAYMGEPSAANDLSPIEINRAKLMEESRKESDKGSDLLEDLTDHLLEIRAKRR